MAKSVDILLDFEIDKLTNSILNCISGNSFATEVSLLKKQELKGVTKRKRWGFNWRTELAQNDREVYKLTIVSNPGIIQGLTSLTIKSDYVYMNLVESSPFNIGKNKLYEGVPGNLTVRRCGCFRLQTFLSKRRRWTRFFSGKNQTDRPLRKNTKCLSLRRAPDGYRLYCCTAFN